MLRRGKGRPNENDLSRYHFKSDTVTPHGDGSLDLKGDLTIHGVTKPVVLKVEGPTGEQEDPGVLVGNQVKIELEVSLIKS